MKKNPFENCVAVKADPYEQYVHIATSRREFERLYRYLADETPETKNSQGMFSHLVSEKTGQPVFILGWFNQDPVTLSHELVHACFRILGYVGVISDEMNNEAFAYLHTHLMKQVLGKAK